MPWLSTSAEIATAAGLFVLSGQLQAARATQRSTFEQIFSGRYTGIIDRLPLEEIIGLEQEPDEANLRHYYDYFTLCEEELYFRQRRKVSRSTWCDWWEGICMNMRRPAFEAAWNRLSRETGHFRLLNQAFQDTGGPESNRPYDPPRATRRLRPRRLRVS